MVKMLKRGTGQKIVKLAGKLLRKPSTSPKVRKLAASALTQFKAPIERTTAPMAAIASDILRDGRYSDAAHQLAASVLAQRKK